jgi:hypothetical protein
VNVVAESTGVKRLQAATAAPPRHGTADKRIRDEEARRFKTENLFVSSPLDLLSNVPAESTGPEALLSSDSRPTTPRDSRQVFKRPGGQAI